MSTRGLLEQSVMVAGESVTPMVGTLRELTEDIKNVNPRLLNAQERDLLAISKALGENMPLINIATAISAGGANTDGFPNLAVASYEMSIKKNDVGVRTDLDGYVSYQELGGFWSIYFPDGTLPPRKKFMGGFWGSGFQEAETSVPLVPLKLRQLEPDRLFLLFEVSVWKRVVRPVDPYLLKHIAGLIYAVVGTWDVTEQEINAYQTARKLGI